MKKIYALVLVIFCISLIACEPIEPEVPSIETKAPDVTPIEKQDYENGGSAWEGSNEEGNDSPLEIEFSSTFEEVEL